MAVVTVGPLTRVTDQQSDNLGVFDHAVAGLTDTLFLVAHQFEDVGSDGFASNPSDLGVRAVTVDSSLNITAHTWVSAGDQCENGTPCLVALDATHALLIFQEYPSDDFIARIVTVTGTGVTLGGRHLLVSGGPTTNRILATKVRDGYVAMVAELQDSTDPAWGLRVLAVDTISDTIATVASAPLDSAFEDSFVPPFHFSSEYQMQDFGSGRLLVAATVIDYASSNSYVLAQPFTVDASGSISSGSAAQAFTNARAAGHTGARFGWLTSATETLLTAVDWPSGGVASTPQLRVAVPTFDWTVPSLTVAIDTLLLSSVPGAMWTANGRDDLAPSRGGHSLFAWSVFVPDDGYRIPRLILGDFNGSSLTEGSRGAYRAATDPTPDDEGNDDPASIGFASSVGLVAVSTGEDHWLDYPVDDNYQRIYNLFLQAFRITSVTPPLRQFPRDDGLRRNPARSSPTSRQGSPRRGPRGNYL